MSVLIYSIPSALHVFFSVEADEVLAQSKRFAIPPLGACLETLHWSPTIHVYSPSN
jgi:hypothetical protein